tara:strand:+ start:2120 stop:3301 length:1182 start_codon:yes stop_codon:yes gene_type:complete
MARNRVIYQSEALYASPTDSSTGSCRMDHGFTNAANKPKQVQRVQNANYSFSIERQDVNQFGELAAIDRIILTSPTVSLDFQYLVANMVNENNLGFHVSGSGTWKSCISGILNKTTDEKCYYIRTVAEGADAGGDTPVDHDDAGQNVIGLGNSYITSYTAEGSVGNFPTVSINVEALNMKVYGGSNPCSGEYIPAIVSSTGAAVDASTGGAHKFILPDAARHSESGATTSVLRPGDVTVEIFSAGSTTVYDNDGGANIGHDQGDARAKLQSYNVSFDLSRTPLEQLGSKFAFSREIDFPVTITASLEAMVADLVAGNLASIITTDGELDIYIKIKDPASATINAAYHIKKAKLDSQEFSSGIGDNKSVTLNFSAQVGGPGQNTVGFFMSGVTS